MIIILTEKCKQKVSLFQRIIQFDSLKQETKSVNHCYEKDCDFQNLLDESIKYKFVVGMKTGSVLHRLCGEKPNEPLNLLEIALAKEAALTESNEKKN